MSDLLHMTDWAIPISCKRSFPHAPLVRVTQTRPRQMPGGDDGKAENIGSPLCLYFQEFQSAWFIAAAEEEFSSAKTVRMAWKRTEELMGLAT